MYFPPAPSLVYVCGMVAAASVYAVLCAVVPGVYVYSRYPAARSPVLVNSWTLKTDGSDAVVMFVEPNVELTGAGKRAAGQATTLHRRPVE